MTLKFNREKTEAFGLAIGYDTEDKEFVVHLLFWHFTVSRA